jgi:hypothetical protein
VIVLQAKTNRLADLRPLVPRLLAAIESAMPGAAKFVGVEQVLERRALRGARE